MALFADDAVLVPPAVLEESIRTCLGTSFVNRLTDGTPPTLVVGGLHDAIFTPQVLRDAVVAPIPQGLAWRCSTQVMRSQSSNPRNGPG